MFNLNDAPVVDTVLALMRTSTVVCSFLHVGGGASCGYVLYILLQLSQRLSALLDYRMLNFIGISRSRFGYIPHTSLMQFIATATSGAYMCSCPRVSMVTKCLLGAMMNLYLFVIVFALYGSSHKNEL